jgi:multiple sugar transport system substrate-binding protein
MKEDGSVYPNESSLDDSNTYSFFGQGKYAMFLSGSWATNNIKRDFPEFDNYRIIPLPIPDEGLQGGLPYLTGSGQFYISSQTKHPNESWLWIDWMSSHEFHERMVSKGLEYSVYPELNSPELITDSHKWEAYEAVTSNLVTIPFPPARNPETALVSPQAVVPDTGDVLVGIYTGQIGNWQEALTDLDERKQAALEDAIAQAQASGANVSIDDFIFADWDPMKDYITPTGE